MSVHSGWHGRLWTRSRTWNIWRITRTRDISCINPVTIRILRCHVGPARVQCHFLECSQWRIGWWFSCLSTHSVDDYSAAKPALVYKHIDVELNEILTMPFEKKKASHTQTAHTCRQTRTWCTQHRHRINTAGKAAQNQAIKVCLWVKKYLLIAWLCFGPMHDQRKAKQSRAKQSQGKQS